MSMTFLRGAEHGYGKTGGVSSSFDGTGSEPQVI